MSNQIIDFLSPNSHHIISALLQRFGSPLYVYDLNRIRANFTRIHDAFASRYPNFKLCYSVKANNNRALLHLLQKGGAGFDCSSPGEIYLARKSNANFIVYTSAYTTKDEMQFALQNNTDIITLDDSSLLDIFHTLPIPETLAFRLNPYGKYDESAYSLSGKDSKFGMDQTTLIEAVKRAKKMGVRTFGIHAMSGSCILNPATFADCAQRIMETAAFLKNQHGISISSIDLGGGFGIPYTNNQIELDIEQTAQLVTDIIQSYVENHSLTPPKLIIEPGRYIMGTAGYLLGTVHTIKHAHQTFIGTDISVNSILRIPLLNAYNRITVAGAAKNSPVHPVTICGQMCCEFDIIAKDRKLPPVSVGSHIVIHDVGAYGFVHSNQFNTRQRPAEVLLDGDESYLIRSRESLEEFDRLVSVPPCLDAL